MAQTEKSWADVETLLADNTTQLISARDLRDSLASTMGYAGILLSIAGAPATINSVGTTPVLMDVFNVVTANSASVNASGTLAALSSTYDLTIGATGIYHIGFFASFSSSASNRTVTFTPHVNGSPGLVQVQRFVGTGADVGSVAFDGIIPYTAGDKIDMRVSIDTGTSNLTFQAAGLNTFRVG